MCDTGGSSGSSKMELSRLFLRRCYQEIDPALPHLLSVLQSVGASECWHKHGTFFDHLLHVYQILKLWNAPDAVARCGLFHSAYSNSYVNLAIFKVGVERQRVRDLVGDEAEELIHLFCIVPRQELIYDMLLFKHTDEELERALQETDHLFDEQGEVKKEEVVQLGSRTPLMGPQGLTVKHIRTGQDLHLSRHLVAIFLLLTMADFVDQFFSWQDELFGNHDGKLEFQGDQWQSLWPGETKPGLWMSSVSKMGLLLNILIREEKLQATGAAPQNSLDCIPLRLPPVFNNCSLLLPPAHQIRARDLYQRAMHPANNDMSAAQHQQEQEHVLEEACLANPWVAEPHLALAQILLSTGRHHLAAQHAQQGLQLLLEWGTCWDKKVSWEGWMAWARVLLHNASHQQWPDHAWGINSLGLVN